MKQELEKTGWHDEVFLVEYRAAIDVLLEKTFWYVGTRRR